MLNLSLIKFQTLLLQSRFINFFLINQKLFTAFDLCPFCYQKCPLCYPENFLFKFWLIFKIMHLWKFKSIQILLFIIVWNFIHNFLWEIQSLKLPDIFWLLSNLLINAFLYCYSNSIDSNSIDNIPLYLISRIKYIMR